MKHIFIVNPAAGQGNAAEELIKDIRETCSLCEIEPIIYKTRFVGDGQTAARRIAADLNGEEARIYACGGDGTVNEVLNGIMGNDNISMGIFPIGTGNDTIRNFDLDKDTFLNVEAQIKGTLKPLDVMKYEGEINGSQQSRFCINMFNNGFDCNVVEAMETLKTKPLISGSAAYYLAIAQMFVQKKGISLIIEADGQLVSSGFILLCAISNGCFCGGGIKSSPQSIMDDGLMDLTIIQDVTRRRFLQLFPSFAKGEHLGRPDVADVIQVLPCQHIKLRPYEVDQFMFCADGEIAHTTGLDIQIMNKAVNFIVPEIK